MIDRHAKSLSGCAIGKPKKGMKHTVILYLDPRVNWAHWVVLSCGYEDQRSNLSVVPWGLSVLLFEPGFLTDLEFDDQAG